jgi:hypothetical protein
MPVDPGLHVVVADRGGAKIFEDRLELREAERRSVRVALAEGAAAATSPRQGDPGRLVIEPKPPRVDLAARPKPRGRWIFEPGVFVAYLGVTAAHPNLESPRSVALASMTAGQPSSSCGSTSCEVGEVSGASAALGINVLAGYALGDDLDLGVRILAAPTVSGDAGGVWGFGPALVLHPNESLSLGLWGLFGDASVTRAAVVVGPPGYNVSPQLARAEGTLAGGLGAGVEVSLRLFELGRGTVVANTTPFFLSGNGSAFCVPVGVAYHFQ